MAHKVTKAVTFPDGSVYPYDNIWDDALSRGHCTLLKGEVAQEALTDYRRAELLAIIQPGGRITTVCTKPSNGGTGSARYKVLCVANEPRGYPYVRNITRMVADLVGFKLSKDDEIIMGGWGYSKSFQIGYSLGWALWPHGTAEPHGTRNGKPDHDGGYALTVDAY